MVYNMSPKLNQPYLYETLNNLNSSSTYHPHHHHLNSYSNSLIPISPIHLVHMITFASSITLTLIISLAAIAFFTLLERKYLGYSQTRKGPNKVSITGIPQPIADALKLFSKHISYPSIANTSPYLISPILNLSLALML